MRFDKDQPYATVTGHPLARYEQNGKLYDGHFVQISTTKRVEIERDRVVETDEVDSARRFLARILESGPLAKPKIFQIAEQNNQKWEYVKQAASLIQVAKYQYGGSEMWKLTEDA